MTTATATDPVCGMPVPDGGIVINYHGRQFAFCSEFCRDAFVAAPEVYAGATPLAAGRADSPRRVAYFSMEVAVDAGMPTYSGGLGVLAGDTLKSAADLGLPVVAVSLLNAKGYFEQTLDRSGNQEERPSVWEPSKFTHLLSEKVEVTIEGRPVKVRGWRYDVTGATGFTVPLILLDTDLSGNDPRDRGLDLLPLRRRRPLPARARSHPRGRWGSPAPGAGAHVNKPLSHERGARRAPRPGTPRDESVAALVGLPRNARQSAYLPRTPQSRPDTTVFRTSLSAKFSARLPEPVVRMLGGAERLDLTQLGMSMSRYVNGVAKRHAEVSREMFPGQPIDAVTNGVHSRTWTCDGFKELYDRHIPGWGNDPAALRSAVGLPGAEVWEAHARAKERLVEEVGRRTGVALAREAFTIGFARRATAYKRADLIFRDPERLAAVAREVGPVQLVFAGKAHPKDEGGKELIRRVFAAAERLRDRVRVVYLENYDLSLAGVLTAGADLWLNTPRRPLEASGTSGMKAAHNGVPSLSTLDGWWAEGHVEGVTGWSIGSANADPGRDVDAEDAEDLYRKLHEVVVPLYYRDRDGWVGVMRHAIALNASFFNTHRMVQQYAANAYV